MIYGKSKLVLCDREEEFKERSLDGRGKGSCDVLTKCWTILASFLFSSFLLGLPSGLCCSPWCVTAAPATPWGRHCSPELKHTKSNTAGNTATAGKGERSSTHLLLFESGVLQSSVSGYATWNAHFGSDYWLICFCWLVVLGLFGLAWLTSGSLVSSASLLLIKTQ